MDGQKRIVIVEDSPTVVAHMKMMLKNSNVKVLNVGSEFGLMQSIESYGKLVDLILMDLTLKTENGMDLIRNLRSNEKYRELPIIIITEHASKALILEAKELKVRSYLKKPIQKDIFLERIYEVIGNVSILPKNTDTGESVTAVGEIEADENEEPATDDASEQTETEEGSAEQTQE
jgi:DNA-binding response OmpR family regulator